ncbi:MAG: RHS repeat-associated core domain-containing protein, partial [bacterium]
TLLANGKAYEIVRVVQKLESPPAEKVTITSKTSYVYGNGQLVAKLQEEPINSAPKIYYYHNDHLGSSRVISDKDGKVVEQYFYYPFGGGGPVGGPTFTGKELDDSGLFYFGARYYDPALGRFITPDPVQIPADNLYVYCANNPLTNIDPNGEFWQFIWAVWKFYTAAKTLYNVYEAYQYGGWDAALMSAGSSWMFNQFSAGISAGIDFGDWGGPLGDIFQLGVEGAITGGISSLMYGGDFWEGARTGAISGVGSGIANALLPILGAVPTAEKETIISDPVDPTDFLGAGKIVVGGIKTVLVGGGKAIGKIGAKVIGRGATKLETHHLLPKEFAERFRDAGLNPEKYTIKISQEKHRLKPGGLHTGPNNWNKQWREFFNKYERMGIKPTREHILQQLEKMKLQFNLK